MNQYKRILVAIDGSEKAENAFNRGVELALALDAELAFVSIVDPRSFPVISPERGAWKEEVKREMEMLLNEYTEEAKEQGIKVVSSFLEIGKPKKMIASEIPKRLDADVIICGATGENQLEKALLGSVSAYILQHGVCDVIIVR